MKPSTRNPELLSRLYSANYYKILEKRVSLPVYEFKDRFTEIVANSQVCLQGVVFWGLREH